MDELKKSGDAYWTEPKPVMPYEEWSRQRRLQQGNAAQIVMESIKDEPDKVAAVLNTAKAFGALSGYVPHFSMAKQFQSDFEREIIRRHNQEILKNTPKLSLWLHDPEFAGVAKDDLGNLGWLEAFAKNTRNLFARAGGRIAQGYSQWQLEERLKAYRHGELESQGNWLTHGRFFEEDKQAEQAKLKDGINYWAEKVDWFSKVGERYPKSLSARGYEELANRGGDDAAWYEALGNYAGAAATNPGKFFAWALETAGESAPQLAAAVGTTIATRNPRLSMAVMGGGSYATERYTSPQEFFHEKGFDLSKPEDVAKILGDPALMKEAAERGHIRGLVIGAFDALSVGIAGKTLADNPFKEALAQSLSQMVLGGAGEALARVAAGQKMDWNEVMAEAFAELVTTPVDMVAAGRKLGAMDKSAQAAKIVKDNLAAMSEKAQSSLLRKRMPDKFREFTDDALKGSGAEVLYVDAGKLNEYFQSLNMDAGQVIRSLDGVGIRDFERALAAGGDIAMPTSSYLADIAGLEHFDAWIQDNARFEPAAMSAAEADTFNEQAETIFRDMAEEEAEIRRREEESLSYEEKIKQEMVSRLRMAGRELGVAQNEALLYASTYRAMAERNGLGIEDMLARYPLPEIRGDLPQSLQEKQVDELTRLLAVARKGAGKPPADKRVSLLEFIDDYGGINDVGGELKAMNADVINRGKGKKTLRLLRHDAGMAGLPGAGIVGGSVGRKYGVDDVAAAVVEAGYLADDPAVMAYKNAMLAGRETPDIVRALWEAIREEVAGRPSYAGEADAAVQEHADLEAQIADLEQYLAGLGVSLEDSDADIRAAIERDRAGLEPKWVEEAEAAEQVAHQEAAKVKNMAAATETVAQAQETVAEQEDAQTPQAREQQAVASMRKVLATKGDVENAVTRPDIGQIDFVWGSDKQAGGFGVAHIIEARMRKDNLTQEQAKKVAEEVARVVATGNIKDSNKEISDNTKTKRIEITNDSHTAVLVQQPEDSKNSWLLTGYETWGDKKDSGGVGVEYDTTDPTHSKPTRSRPEVGAESSNIVAQNEVESKQERDSGVNDQGHDKTIEGARKRAYAEKLAASLVDVIEADIAAKKLNEIWPHPDYNKLLEEGADKRNVAALRALRDTVRQHSGSHALMKGQWVKDINVKMKLARQWLMHPFDKESFDIADEFYSNGWVNIKTLTNLYLAVGHKKSLKGLHIRSNSDMWALDDGTGRGGYSLSMLPPGGYIKGSYYVLPATQWWVEGNKGEKLATGESYKDAIANFARTHLGREPDPIALIDEESLDEAVDTGDVQDSNQETGQDAADETVQEQDLTEDEYTATPNSIASYLRDAAGRADILGKAAATEKQIRYLARLLFDAKQDASDVGIEPGGGILTRKAASEAIGYYLTKAGHEPRESAPREQTPVNTDKGKNVKKTKPIKIGVYKDLDGDGYYIGAKIKNKIVRLKEFDSQAKTHDYLSTHMSELRQQIDEIVGGQDAPKDKAAGRQAQREYGQAERDSGGRAATATINADVVLEPLKLENLPKIDGYKNAQKAVVKGTFENRSGDKVLVSNRSVTKWFHGRENAIKRSLAPHFHKIFEQSVTYHEGQNGFSYAAGLINLDGKQVAVRFAVKQAKGNPDKLYYVEGIEVVSEEGLPPIYHESLKDKSIIGLERGGDTRGFNVAQIVEAFNRLEPQSRPLFQGRYDGRRGSIQIGQDGAAIINLFQRADLSTLVHESGHFFLNIMQDMALRGEASAAQEMAVVKQWWRGNVDGVIKDANGAVEGAAVDVADVEAWLDNGTTGNEVKDRAIDIGTQEQFARGFEAYLMEGKAPSVGLRAAFEKFRSWLIAIYKRLASLDVKLSDEIRGVFDRMIATDEAIEEARGQAGDMSLMRDMADSDYLAGFGLDEQQRATLAEMRREAVDEAKNALLRQTMQPLKRAREQWYKKEREKVRGQIEGEVNAQKHYRAFEFMANGRWLGEDIPDVGQLKLSKQQLVERYGAGVLKTLPRGKQTVYAAENGTDIDMVADLFGFKSGDEMVRALERMPNRKQAIDAETDKVMRERHGDVLNDGEIEAKALEAVHNDRKGELLAAELRAVWKHDITFGQAKAFAAQEIAAMKVGQARQSDQFLAAERKAGREANKIEVALVAKGQPDAAQTADWIKAKQRQLLNHALYQESMKVAREVDSLLKRVRRLEKAIGKIRSGRKRLGETKLSGDYIEPIEAILSSYEFRRVSNKRLDRRAALNAFVAKMEEEGRANELAIPESVLADARQVNYQSLTVEHLRGVVDALKNIEHMARLKGKLLMANKQRDFEKAKGVIIDALEKNLKQKDIEWIGKQGFIERIKKGGRDYLALVMNATTIIRRIDGREDLGAVYELLKSPLDEAAFGERHMLAQATDDIKKLYDVYSVDEQRQMAVMKTYDELGGRSLSRWNLIAMALNMGNEGNLARLTNNRARHHLTGQEVDAVKGLLTKKDWDFVQSVWDYIETWKEKIAARDRRLRGIEPKWVAAKEVATPYGVYRGGYYPIKYDAEHGGNRRKMGDGDDEIIDSMMRGSFAAATTKDGHLKARMSGSHQSLKLDMSVITTHVNEVIHDLQFNEPVVNAWRLLNNNEVEAAFARANLKEAYTALKLWVQDVGAGQIMADNNFARGINKLRSGFTISKLAYNAYTVVQQPLGAGQAMEMVGARNLARAMLDYSKDISGHVKEVLEKSNIMWERRNTFNRDLMDAVAQSNLASPKSGRVKSAIDDYIVPYGMLGLVATQFYTVDVPTWIAAYRKGLKQFGGEEAKAIHYADMAVSASQASGLFLDRSAIERGTLSSSIRQNPFVLLMTTLGSYFFAKQNRIIERTQGLRAEKITLARAMDYAYHMSLLLLFEAAIVQTVKWALKDKDDDDDDSLLGEIALDGLENYLAGVPMVRDMVGAAKGFDAGTYAAISNTFVRPVMRAVEGKFDGSFTKGAVNLTGVLTRLPSTQTNRLLDGLMRQAEGEDASMMEFIFGRSRK